VALKAMISRYSSKPIRNDRNKGGQGGSEWTTCQNYPVHRLSSPGLQKTTWTTWTADFGDDHHKKNYM